MQELAELLVVQDAKKLITKSSEKNCMACSKI